MNDLETGVRQALENGPHREAPRWSPPTGDQVKALRERLGLTQVEFAERYRLDLGSLRNWEQDRHIPEGTGRQVFWMIEADPVEALRLIHKASTHLQQPAR